MEDYQLRVIEEEKQLKTKIGKLCNFIESDIFTKLDPIDCFLLRRQYKIMDDYDLILKSRIKRFKQ